MIEMLAWIGGGATVACLLSFVYERFAVKRPTRSWDFWPLDGHTAEPLDWEQFGVEPHPR